MYDLPELEQVTDAWWAVLAQSFQRQGVDAIPTTLRRGAKPASLWRSPDLLFSQCCGYDLTHDSASWLRLIATPCYATPYCQGAHYRSLIMVREDDPAQTLNDLRGQRCAINYLGSHSGYNALRAVLAKLVVQKPFFATVVSSGSHANSLTMVGEGDADVAAIDCVSYALLQRYRPALTTDLRILQQTPLAPGLPYVTRADASDSLVKRLQAGLSAALADSEHREIRAALLIKGIEELPSSAYQRIMVMEQEAIDCGYERII